MKYIRNYNTKAKLLDGWPTTDKRAAIEIYDPDNGHWFIIQMGKVPKIDVYKTPKHEPHENVKISKILASLSIHE